MTTGVNKPEIRGIGGWLAFFLFGLGVGSLISIVNLPTTVTESIPSELAGASLYLFGAYLLLVVLFGISLQIYTIYSFIKLKSNAVYLGFLVLALTIIDNIFLLFTEGNTSTFGLMFSPMNNVIKGVIWFLYLTSSVRVKNTFPYHSWKFFKRDKIILSSYVCLLILGFIIGAWAGQINNLKPVDICLNSTPLQGEIEETRKSLGVKGTEFDNIVNKFEANSDPHDRLEQLKSIDEIHTGFVKSYNKLVEIYNSDPSRVNRCADFNFSILEEYRTDLINRNNQLQMLDPCNIPDSGATDVWERTRALSLRMQTFSDLKRNYKFIGNSADVKIEKFNGMVRAVNDYVADQDAILKRIENESSYFDVCISNDLVNKLNEIQRDVDKIKSYLNSERTRLETA